MVVTEVVLDMGDLEVGALSGEKQHPHERQQPCCDSLEIPPSSYFDNVVKPMVQHRPWLEVLYQFMDPETKGIAVSLRSRMRHFDIKVVHFDASGHLDWVVKCATPAEFTRAISQAGDQMGTIIIAKGLSRAMIQALGEGFDLEPEMFANHLAGSELYWGGRYSALRPPARAPFLLPEVIRSALFYTAEYRRPYQIEGGQQHIFDLRVMETTVPRGVSFIHDEMPDVFGYEKISVCRRKNSKIGIILTDQLLSDIPATSIMRNLVMALSDYALNDIKSANTSYCHRQTSARQELIAWLRSLTSDEARNLFSDHQELALRPVLKIVERNSSMFLSYARHTMMRILSRHCDAKFPNDIPFFLHISRSLHRIIHDQRMLLTYALRVASLRSNGCDPWEQERDFEFLASDLASAMKALEEDVRYLIGEASIQEGKTVGWVSKFAALFLPVSLLATILSISSPGYERWVVLGGLSVPFVLISIYFMFVWKPAYLR